MASYRAFAPGVEVNGESVNAIVDGMGAFKSKALEKLAKHGIKDPKPGLWYPQQAWLDAFSDIGETIGQNVLNTIGQKIPENAKFPPGIDTLEKALSSIDVAYHSNHRGGEVGSYRIEEMGPHSARLVCHNPYPCAFDQGIIEAITRRFKPAGSSFIAVEHDANGPCRNKGADRCVYLVKW